LSQEICEINQKRGGRLRLEGFIKLLMEYAGLHALVINTVLACWDKSEQGGRGSAYVGGCPQCTSISKLQKLVGLCWQTVFNSV